MLRRSAWICGGLLRPRGRGFVSGTVPPQASDSSSSSSSKESAVWQLGVLNHIAIAVPDLDRATRFYRDILKADVSEKVALPEHGVYTVFVNVGNTKLELLHPLGERSPIANFLQKKPDGGMHHICLEVDNVYAAVEDLKRKGVRALDPKPKIGAHGKPVVFLHPKDCGGVLVELENKT